MRGSICELLPALFLALIASVYGDPDNLVQNGGFEIQVFEFELFPQLDVSHDAEMQYIPNFIVMRGGVQVLDGNVYSSENGSQGGFLIHMNYGRGPGVLQTAAMTTPRKGATYNVSFKMADNPDGGPLHKGLMVRILVNNQVATPLFKAFAVSTPYTTRDTIMWNVASFTFVGTGEATTLQIESLVPGPLGPLIDDVEVKMLTLVDNGSFENISTDFIRSNITYYNVVASLSSVLRGWTVTTGKIKLSGNERWESSTDGTTFMLDLNAESSAGSISSSPFSTRPGKKYKLLFDAAANPDTAPPLMGHILASVISSPGGHLVASRSVLVTGEGFTPFSIGWVTYVLEFEAQERLTILEFKSLIKGSPNGPLLDNVRVFEILKPGYHKSVRTTFNGGTALKPSIWATVLAGGLVICVFWHLSETLSPT